MMYNDLFGFPELELSVKNQTVLKIHCEQMNCVDGGDHEPRPGGYTSDYSPHTTVLDNCSVCLGCIKALAS